MLPTFQSSVAGSLASLNGVTAVVLGGSHARGTAKPDSDLDIGIYYRDSIDIGAVREIAQSIAREGTDPVVTQLYEWGRWVNGGAWIETASGKVDFLYRNVADLERVWTDSQAGHYLHDFDQQPTFGFRSYIYLAEVRCCRPLVDSSNFLPEWKLKAAEYPQKLRERLVRESPWMAEFTHYHLRNFIERGDNWNAAGCLGRIVFYLLQALFALNREFYFGDKGAMEFTATFPIRPDNFLLRINTLTSSLTTVRLTEAAALIAEVKALCASAA
jgi:hypothetical protein